jgi:hypothetical protein
METESDERFSRHLRVVRSRSGLKMSQIENRIHPWQRKLEEAETKFRGDPPSVLVRLICILIML